MLPRLWFDTAKSVLGLDLDFWRRVTADLSKLAFRQTVAEYGVDLTWTPMVVSPLNMYYVRNNNT